MYGLPGVPYGETFGAVAQRQPGPEYVFTPDGSQRHLLRDEHNNWHAGVVDDFGTVCVGRWNPPIYHRTTAETL